VPAKQSEHEMQIDIINFDGKAVGKADLVDTIFGLEPRADILHRVVTWQRNKARAGTHKVKTVSDITGSSKKMVKQKKTGRARQGERFNVHMRGGAVVHGPHPRDHATELPKKIRALGLKMALSSKVKDGTLLVIDSEKVAAAKTATMVKHLGKLKLTNALFVGADAIDANFKKSTANIPYIDVLPTMGLNVLDILKHNNLVLTKDAIAAIEKRLG